MGKRPSRKWPTFHASYLIEIQEPISEGRTEAIRQHIITRISAILPDTFVGPYREIGDSDYYWDSPELFICFSGREIGISVQTDGPAGVPLIQEFARRFFTTLSEEYTLARFDQRRGLIPFDPKNVPIGDLYKPDEFPAQETNLNW